MSQIRLNVEAAVAPGSAQSRSPNPDSGWTPPAVNKPHQISRADARAPAVLQRCTQAIGLFALLLVEFTTAARLAVDTVIDQIGRQTIVTIPLLSGQEVAGARTPGQPGGEVRWHGSQPGRVMLAGRAVRVSRLRLRHRQYGEVAVPGFNALQKSGTTADRTLGALLRGVSTRDCADAIPWMAAAVGVKKTSISPRVIEVSARQFRQLRERRCAVVGILVICIDGQRFGAHHIMSAVGVVLQGKKHVLGIEAGAT